MRQLSSNTLKLNNISHMMSYGDSIDRMSFTSYLHRPGKSGFTVNQRPAVYYEPSLDHIDNPQFGLLLSDSFMSETKTQYQPYIQSNRSVTFPNNKPSGSGFHQLKTLLRAGPVEDKTEHQSSFYPHPLTSVVQSHRIVGPKTDTGFTRGMELQLNTFQNKNSSMLEPRQTFNSVMKSDFMFPSLVQDTKGIPDLSIQSKCETGFRQEFSSSLLSHPSSLLPSHQTRSTVPTIKIIGKKELTGFLSNFSKNDAFPKTPFDSSHFETHYKSTFCGHGDSRKLRSDLNKGIITAKMNTGFSHQHADRLTLKG